MSQIIKKVMGPTFRNKVLHEATYNLQDLLLQWIE